MYIALFAILAAITAHAFRDRISNFGFNWAMIGARLLTHRN